MFNNTAFSCAMMRPMNIEASKDDETAMRDSMARLYQAAKQLRGIEGKSAVARLLNVAPQNVGNWEARGVPAEAILDAEELIGCSGLWVRKGLGPMVVGEPYEAPKPEVRGGLADSLKRTTETSQELQMLLVYRFADAEGRREIDLTVDNVREQLGIQVTLDQTK